MKVRIVPYKRGSASAKLLAKTLSDEDIKQLAEYYSSL
jgi:cytochrome c553